MINISLLYHRRIRNVHNYHTQSFVLCDIEQESRNVGTHEIILQSRRGGFIQWAGSLRTGIYVLIPFSTSFWLHDGSEEENITRDFTLVIHSSHELNGTLIKESPTLLADCLIAATLKYCKKAEKVCRKILSDCFYLFSSSSMIRMDIAPFIQPQIISLPHLSLRKICLQYNI